MCIALCEFVRDQWTTTLTWRQKFFWRADGDGENEKENKVNVLASSEKSIERASERGRHAHME